MCQYVLKNYDMMKYSDVTICRDRKNKNFHNFLILILCYVIKIFYSKYADYFVHFDINFQFSALPGKMYICMRLCK